MNIGISTSVIQRGQTGIAQHLFGLLKAFAAFADTHRFTLFVLEDDMPLFESVREKMSLFPVAEKFRPALNNIFWHHTALPRLARQHGLDVVHVPSYRRLTFSLPCPAVGTIHDLAPFHVAGKYDALRMFYGRVVARRLARRQSALIAVSRTTAADITRFFKIPAERIQVVYNGVDSSRFFPGNREQSRLLVRTRYNIADPFLLYVARLEHPGKNHLRLIEAFNAFKRQTRSDWVLALGGSDWHGAKVIDQAIRVSPFARDIRKLGFVPDADLPELYRAAEAFVYPSLFEGFGLPPLEAMACDCPVICSNRGSLAEVTESGAHLIDPENVGALSRALAEVATDARLRDSLRCAGLARARQFTWERAAAETIQVYERAAGRVNEAAVC